MTEILQALQTLQVGRRRFAERRQAGRAGHRQDLEAGQLHCMVGGVLQAPQADRDVEAFANQVGMQR